MLQKSSASLSDSGAPAPLAWAGRVAPGLALSLALTALAYGLQWAEGGLAGKAWLTAPVIAIILGTVLRSFWMPGAAWLPGIRFSNKYLLEIAIVLIGAALSAQAMLAVGPALLAAIIAVTVLSICATYAIGRLIGVEQRTATLIACGNSICGNSAIVAVAPVIGAKNHEVATSIAFTAAVSVPVVVALPLAVGLLQMSHVEYGVLAGLTVYAVPQVLAATAPIGALAVDTGTIVKLGRVVMLGPVCVVLAIIMAMRAQGEESGARLSPSIIPWFILGFVIMAAIRSMGLIPDAAIPVLAETSSVLTVVSLAALGLGVDIRAAIRTGPRVVLLVLLSLAVLLAMSVAVIGLVPLA